MLEDILRFIFEKGYISKTLIAQELNIPENLVESSFQQLLRMDYLKEDKQTSTCNTACASCPYAKSCNKELVKSYSLTDKALKLLQK